jgi:hypothetical protein
VPGTTCSPSWTDRRLPDILAVDALGAALLKLTAVDRGDSDDLALTRRLDASSAPPDARLGSGVVGALTWHTVPAGETLDKLQGLWPLELPVPAPILAALVGIATLWTSRGRDADGR